MVQKHVSSGKMYRQWPYGRVFGGILKRELTMDIVFTDRETLIKAIEEYIEYYNTKRLQRNLGVLTPMEKHASYWLAA